MKKTLKSILSGAMILSMLGGYAVPVSAETDSTGKFYYKSVPCWNNNIDRDSEEFHDFLQNAEIYNSGFQHSAEDKFYTIQYNIIGNDKNGNLIITDKYDCALKGFDENDVPVIMYEQLAIPDLAMLCGFDSEFGPVYCGYNEFLVRENENGERKLVNMEWIETNNKFYISRTVDLHTGKNIIVKNKNNTYDYVVIEQGDVNLDENVNIIDVAKYAQHIIKISEIPEYADIAADMNGDGSVDIKDLTMLKKQLIGEEEKNITENADISKVTLKEWGNYPKYQNTYVAYLPTVIESREKIKDVEVDLQLISNKYDIQEPCEENYKLLDKIYDYYDEDFFKNYVLFIDTVEEDTSCGIYKLADIERDAVLVDDKKIDLNIALFFDSNHITDDMSLRTLCVAIPRTIYGSQKIVWNI